MRMRSMLSIAAGVLVGTLSAAVLFVMPRPALNGQTVASGKVAIGGPFSLIDHTGKRVTEKDYAGRRLLVYFGFTNCPDICPSGLQVISAALDNLGTAADKIAPVFITVDPERDTVPVLADYVKSFHPRIAGLTGTPEEIAAVAKAYRVYYRKVVEDPSSGRYSVDHSGFMYLMDEQGQFLQHFPHSVAVDKLAQALAKGL